MTVKKTHVAKHKTFHGGLTSQTLVFILIPLLVASGLIYTGIHNSRLFPAKVDMSARALFVYVPPALGVFIIVIMLITINSYIRIRVTITPKTISFKHGSKEFDIYWDSLIYTPHRKYSKDKFRSMIISDGKSIGRINSMFFPHYSTLASLIEAARAQYTDGEYLLNSEDFQDE